MVPLHVIRKSVSDTARGFPAMGILYNDVLNMIRTPDDTVADIIARLHSSYLRAELNRRLRDSPWHPGYHDISLPFSVSAKMFPIDTLTATSSALVVITSTNPNMISKLDYALLGSLPRKHKKMIGIILKTMKEWTHPRIEEVEGLFNEVAVSLRKDVDAYYDESLTKTLVSYKDFVGSFAHEALTPIQEIRTSLELTVNQPSIDKQSSGRLQQSLHALDSLRVSLEGMRLLFRDDEKKPLANQFRDCDIRTTIDNWLTLYERQFSEKNIEVICEPQTGAWRLKCVPEYLEVLIRNLVSNGVKYSFDAKGYDEPGKFIVRYESSVRRLSFVNYGIPIAQSEIESGTLFTRGHRGATADDRGRVGKGVGLYLVKRVTDLHKADCQVKSAIQNPSGHQKFARTEFAITFPGLRGGL